MGHSILILDDDDDFNCLLSDIFEQGDYSVTSVLDPLKAIEIFNNSNFELVVTDHKMPGMSGAEFMKLVKQTRLGVPVIIVSGYLDNDTIRELIGAGVGGVFLKPLNIFSLLQRTSELIAETEKKRERSEVHESAGNEAQYDKIGFNFLSFPCRSDASLKFAQRIHSLKEFNSSLTLVGESGTCYHSICEDIRGFYNDPTEHFIYWSPSSFDQDKVFSMIAAAQSQGASRVTCVLLKLEGMSEDQKLLARELAKSSSVFADFDMKLRTIFCVNGDLDLLMDEGVIDENLYMLMGTSEVMVPALRNCLNDIPVLAQQLVVQFAAAQGLATVPRFNRAARDLLQQQPLIGNHEELSLIVRAIVEHSHGDVLTAILVQDVLKQMVASSPRRLLQEHLAASQVDYAFAVNQLYQGDHGKVAEFFGAECGVIDSFFKREVDTD
ncbi:MAG: two-component system NtrC family response regulator [Lentimonas sp.]|jgi:two-component system NtrC family response regulator